MKNLFAIIILSIVACIKTFALSADSTKDYHIVYDSMTKLIEQNQPHSFKQAVFITENTYLHGAVDYNEMDKSFELLAALAINCAHNNHIQNYTAPDSQQMLLNRAAYEAYMLFHTAAPSQFGPVYLKLYDEKGTRTNNTQDAVKADWSVQKDNEPEKVIQTLHQ